MPLPLSHVLRPIHSPDVQKDLPLLVAYDHIALKDVGTHYFVDVLDSLDESPLL